MCRNSKFYGGKYKILLQDLMRFWVNEQILRVLWKNKEKRKEWRHFTFKRVENIKVDNMRDDPIITGKSKIISHYSVVLEKQLLLLILSHNSHTMRKFLVFQSWSNICSLYRLVLGKMMLKTKKNAWWVYYWKHWEMFKETGKHLKFKWSHFPRMIW